MPISLEVMYFCIKQICVFVVKIEQAKIINYNYLEVIVIYMAQNTTCSTMWAIYELLL